MSITKKSILIILLILIIDQTFKFWVKTHMTLGQYIPVIGNWFQIRFIENPGMAFGIDIPGKFGKLALSLFRIFAVGGIAWYLRVLILRKAPHGLIIGIAMILAGAIGNIIDSSFYGLIFSESNYNTLASLFPSGGGYAHLLHGQVVDMLYFPLIDTHYPNWIPFLGGKQLVFFRPIFNIADSSITIGVASILIFQRKFFKGKD